MSSRKQSHFDADGPYLIRPAPIGSFRFGEDDIAHLVAFDHIEGLPGQGPDLFWLLRQLLRELGD